MKTPTLICALLLALVFPARVVGQGKRKSNAPQAGVVEQQLKQIEDEWQKAIKNKEAAALRRIIAEDWVGTDDKGKVLNREPYISQTTSNPDVIESAENFDMQVRVYGNTAAVTGGNRERGTRNGTAYADTYRWTDVFVKRGDRWQAVVSQWAKMQAGKIEGKPSEQKVDPDKRYEQCVRAVVDRLLASKTHQVLGYAFGRLSNGGFGGYVSTRGGSTLYVDESTKGGAISVFVSTLAMIIPGFAMQRFELQGELGSCDDKSK